MPTDAVPSILLDMKPIKIVQELRERTAALSFAEPVTHVYAPLDYASKAVERYLEKYARVGGEALMLGMNPGPWGMAQTGVPFGEVAHVRDFLGIECPVGKPDHEHPKRPVQGFDCPRSEVSGRRFWGWAQERFGSADAFFDRFFVWNWCPLAFLEESGRNRTPDKLPAGERVALEAVCDDALRKMVEALRPQMVIGIGAYAMKRAAGVVKDMDVPVGSILHPSPASPIANRGWAPQAEAGLEKLGISLPAGCLDSADGPAKTGR
ncbi:MAG: single-stranded DNA-binding protein [Phycisphaerales bacterium]|nr:single-stranded DNA-binding protein [Phycisphaerales bacterium]